MYHQYSHLIIYTKFIKEYSILLIVNMLGTNKDSFFIVCEGFLVRS